MALKIRLRQQGRNNRATYRLVVTDCRSPRDGKYVEMLGWYNPFESVSERTLLVKADRVQHWLDQGAEMSDKAKSLIAQAAPALVRKQVDKVVAHRAKMASKRKAQGEKKSSEKKSSEKK
ncbi:MAG: 30S ribosomal protein S16 [Parachlamydia sp.]|nr:30S ribosomal protein S16 [Parachlamydia sp.]